MPPQEETFGTRLIRLRVAKGFATPSDLARAIWGDKPDNRGFMVAANRDTIWRYETDANMPSRKNLELLSKALGCTVEELDPERAARARVQPERPVAQQKALDDASDKPVMSNNWISPTRRVLTIHMELPAEIADKAFDEIAAWWKATGAHVEVADAPDNGNGSGGITLPNPLKRR